MTIYQQLNERELSGNPIRVGVIGAGQMGFGMISQIATIPGMTVGGISDIRLENAQKAKDAYLAASAKPNSVLASTSYREVINSPEVDVDVDATGVPEVGAKICMECLLAKKHVVLLNVEIDITIGTLMYNMFKSAGLVYSGSDGDEPASTFELYSFAKAMGFEALVAGKGKNNKLRTNANPDTVAEEAKERGVAPHMLASFADGTKTMAEMTLLSNACGFKADVTGMHGVSGHLKETVAQLRLKSEGGVLNSYGVVEYVDGLAPGVFVIVKGKSKGVIDQMNYMMKVENDHQILYRPYHLGSLETPFTIAKAVLNHEFSIAPLAGPTSDTVCVAKKDIKAGDPIDGIGGYCVRGVIESHVVTKEKKYIPIGLIAGKVFAKRDIANGAFVTEDDIQLDTNTTVWKLRKLQDEIYG
jgi:predicted homoserine dehydrogenase-like protein